MNEIPSSPLILHLFHFLTPSSIEKGILACLNLLISGLRWLPHLSSSLSHPLSGVPNPSFPSLSTFPLSHLSEIPNFVGLKAFISSLPWLPQCPLSHPLSGMRGHCLQYAWVFIVSPAHLDSIIFLAKWKFYGFFGFLRVFWFSTMRKLWFWVGFRVFYAPGVDLMNANWGHLHTILKTWMVETP